MVRVRVFGTVGMGKSGAAARYVFERVKARCLMALRLCRGSFAVRTGSIWVSESPRSPLVLAACLSLSITFSTTPSLSSTCAEPYLRYGESYTLSPGTDGALQARLWSSQPQEHAAKLYILSQHGKSTTAHISGTAGYNG